MEAVFLKILNMSLTGSWVILAVLLMRLLLKRAPKKYSYALWAVVGFRLICPVSFSAAFSLFSVTPFSVASVSEGPGTAMTYIPEDIGFAAEPKINAGIGAVSDVVNGSLSAVTGVGNMNPIQIWIFVGTVIWCAGTLLMAVWAAVSYLRMRRSLRKATLREADVYECENVRSPFILGFLRPRIYLPYGLEGSTLGYVLSHERCHIRWKDHIVKALAYGVLAVHWFNPLCWLAYYQMCKDMEMRCDEHVLSLAGSVKTEYSMSLLSIASNRRFPSPGPLAFAESSVKMRIKNILVWKRPARWVRTIAVILCLCCLIGCAVNPKEQEGKTTEEPVTFITAEACYLNGLHSVLDDDDRKEYRISDGGVRAVYRSTGGVDFDAEFSSDWMDYSGYEEFWKELVSHPVVWSTEFLEDVIRGEIRLIDENHFLLRLDGVLHIGTYYKDPKGSEYLSSIYSLTPKPDSGFEVEDPVVQYAMDMIDEAASRLWIAGEIEATEGQILSLERVSTGTVSEYIDIALFRFSYRMQADTSDAPQGWRMEDGWLVPDDQTYLLMVRNITNDTWEQICVITEGEIRSRFGTEEMLSEYGNVYTAAAMELYNER